MARTEYERKAPDGTWQVLNPETGNYEGNFASRKAARDARKGNHTSTDDVALDATSQPENTALDDQPTDQSGEQNNACLSENAQDTIALESTVNASQTKETQNIMNEQTIVLTKRNVEKSGNVAYAQDGVRASVYFNKNMFAGNAIPETITITAAEGSFALPGEIKVKATSPEKLAKAKELADKAALAAKKAADRAAKAQARAAKLGVVADAPATESADATE